MPQRRGAIQLAADDRGGTAVGEGKSCEGESCEGAAGAVTTVAEELAVAGEVVAREMAAAVTVAGAQGEGTDQPHAQEGGQDLPPPQI
jgi:hypothetical protein